ncbi:hypothetical protein GCM10010347_65060 [Streptomyces cirratus]|uniref:Uncharacterized protein n=1 Tax=Streptomyces cirratus TaxID=68187 RepID=A0ABQ3F5E2_9ACTN|nr:hypothetical protein [Streptomyces cirratus]GHB85082.1 hypothetical protein GCM10010347_65060 [Streptomyces cirratus]
MGIYVCSVDADDWLDEDILRPTAQALDAELSKRGLASCPPPAAVQFVPQSGMSFEEKMYRPIQTFEDLCRAQSDAQDFYDALLGWDLLVSVDFEDCLTLPVPARYSENTTVLSAHRTLRAAKRLVVQLALPPHVPHRCDNLDLGNWFDSPAAAAAAVSHPGPWAEDLDAAYYAALYLRAAEHSLRRQCPINYV